MSAWEPGVVYGLANDGVRYPAMFNPDTRSWLTVDGDGDCCDYYALPDDDARPLVVIDPEDRERVERFRNETLRMLRDHLGNRAVDESAFDGHDLANAMQAALREFANPTPRIEEPQGLGAVVEDADARLWVKWSTDHREGRNWRVTGFEGGLYERFTDVSVVDVHSEGVIL